MLDDGFYFMDGVGNYTKFPAILTKLIKNPQNPSFTPDELGFTTDRGIPIKPLEEIIFVADGVHVFHGIATKRDNSDVNWKITCKSSQWLLDYRYIPEFIYHDVNLNAVLGNTLSSSTVGALFWINSLIPNGKWTAYSATVAELDGAGTDSIIGSADLWACTSYPNAGTIDGCDGVNQLTDAGAIPTAANQYYRTADKLYVRLGDGSYMPNAFYVAAVNAFDTHIRRGSISLGLKKSNIDFSLVGQAARSLEDFFVKLGLEVQFQPNNDGYVYLNLDDEISRGSAASPIRSYVDTSDCWIAISDTKEPIMQAVIGLTTDENPQPQTAVNWSFRDPQLFKIYENSGLTLANMRIVVASVLDDNEDAYEIQTSQVDYHLRIGDWIQIWKKTVGWKSLRVTKITITPGKMVINVGKRLFSPSQAFGQYLRKTISTSKQALRETEITGGSDTFTVYATDVAAGGLVIMYEESFTVPTDDTSVSAGVFCDVAVNGKVAPPGRIKISDSAAISIDITDACNKSSTSDTTNTILRSLYLATGWETTNGLVKQYAAQAFMDP